MNLANLSIEEKAFLYTSNQYKNAIFEQLFEFDKNVDKEKLRYALKETIKYFTRFGMKAVITKDGKVDLVANDAELPIFDDSNQVFNIGTKDTNGYLYALCVNGAKLRLVLFHVLCDGKGSGYFTQFLILNYIKLAYGDKDVDDEIKKLNVIDENHRKNLQDIIEPYATKFLTEEIKKPFEFETPKNTFVVDKEVKYFYDNSYFTSSIEWDTKALIDTVHKYETTPFVFFFMLIADAMIECFDVKEDTIISNAAVDLRKFLNTASFYNFGTTINVNYKTEWYKLNLENKILNLKNSFAKVLDYNKMIIDMYKVQQMMKQIEKMQNINWLCEKRKENFGKIVFPPFSCFISNVGKVKQIDVIAKHAKSAGMRSTPNNVVPDYTILSHGDTGVLIQNQNFQNDKIMKNVFSKLNDFGIKSKYTDEKKIELSHFDTLKLERL